MQLEWNKYQIISWNFKIHNKLKTKWKLTKGKHKEVYYWKMFRANLKALLYLSPIDKIDVWQQIEDSIKHYNPYILKK